MIVLANGCFDLLHYGHLLHFEEARRFGDQLIVSVTRDEFVNKGRGRPVFNEGQRLHMVGSLKCVDAAILSNSSLDALQLIKPDIFVNGKEYEGKLLPEDIQYCAANNIRIMFTNTPKFSSTELLSFYATHYDEP